MADGHGKMVHGSASMNNGLVYGAVNIAQRPSLMFKELPNLSRRELAHPFFDRVW